MASKVMIPARRFSASARAALAVGKAFALRITELTKHGAGIIRSRTALRKCGDRHALLPLSFVRTGHAPLASIGRSRSGGKSPDDLKRDAVAALKRIVTCVQHCRPIKPRLYAKQFLSNLLPFIAPCA